MVTASGTGLTARLDGAATRPVVAIVGVWDPLVEDHLNLFDALVEHAAGHGLTSLVIVLDPPAPVLTWGPSRWPVYCGVETRRQIIRARGVDAVLTVQFTRESLQATAGDLLCVVDKYVTLAELWLGAQQRIGSGAESDDQYVEAMLRHRGVQLRRLPTTGVAQHAQEVRRLLLKGQITAALQVTGRPPVLERLEPVGSGEVRLGWAPGVYHAFGGATPLGPASGSKFSITVAEDERGDCSLIWPDPGVAYLTFVSGPGDRTQAKDQRSPSS